MRFFVDTADVDQIRKANDMGVICGVTTNPSLIAKEGKVFEAGEVKIWKCRNCGHIVVGTSAPEVCPVCNHPKAFFEIKAENY